MILPSYQLLESLASSNNWQTLGVLAVFNHLLPQMRVVTQLALLPASPTWSAPFQRKALEHPLEPERLRDRRATGGQTTGPATGQLIGMGIIVALLLMWWRFQRQLTAHLPLWLRQAGLAVLHGHAPVLTSAQLTTVIVIGLGVLVGLFCLAFVVLHISSRLGKTPLYDMRLVGEKTARPAYRVRLRLLVFETIPAHPSRQHEKPAVAGYWRRWSWSGMLTCSLRTRKVGEEVFARRWSWSELRKSYQHWRRASQHARHHRQERADLLAQLVAAYRQYHTATGGYFLPHRLSRRQTQRLLKHTPQRTVFFAHQWGWQHGVRRSPHLLSVADIAALWHLPQTHDLAELPYVERGRARTFLAPVNVTQAHGWRLGESSHAGHDVPVFLPDECLRHNLLTVASTGKGKSTLFQHLASAVLAARATSGGGDAEQDRNSTQTARGPSSSLAFIEPHGDVIHALLGRIPARERDNVVVIDLANADYPVGLNPLDMRGRDRDKAVDNLITLAEHLWESSYGSRTENVLEYALKTLADVNEHFIEADPQEGPGRQYTLLDVVPLLRQPEFRHALFEQVRDEMLLDWWQHYYEPMDAHQQREVTSSVITKFSKFASSRRARRILGQPCSTIDMNDIIRAGHILLVSTASGVVGADLSELIGIVLLGFFESALSEQASLPLQERRRYLVLIDEFQVYRGANYQRMLAELRKYGGSFGLATQSLSYLDRLDRTLRSTVLANIDHLFAFHMAGEDARLLHELDGIAEDDITNLDDFQCYVKLSLAGRRLPVFSLHLDAPAPSDEQVATDIRLRSQQRDGRPRGAVDTQLQQSRVRHLLSANPPRVRTGRKSGKERPSAPEQSAPAVDGNAAALVAGESSLRKPAGETVPANQQRRLFPLPTSMSCMMRRKQHLHQKTRGNRSKQENKGVSTSPGEPTPLSRRLPRVQIERMALSASLDVLDWRLLSWLLRYPFQRADDLVVGLAHWASRATVYRHLHILEQNGLVGSVLPKTPAEGKRLYHLSNLGLHLLAAHLDTPTRTLARTYQTDEAGLLRLVPRLPLLLALQNVVNGMVTHAADALTVYGRRPILVRWNWHRDLSHRFRYREQSRRLLVDGAVALCVKTPVGDENWDEQWYGVLLLSTPLEDERVLRMRLERLLCWRECPERWKSYQHMLPVLVLARSLRQRDHWQRAMAQAAQQVGVVPLLGAIGSFPEKEQSCNPWLLNWRTLATESGCHLRDMLQPVQETALPPALRPENDMMSREGEAITPRPRNASTCSAPAIAFVSTRLHRLITHSGAGHPVAHPPQKQHGQGKQDEVDRRETLAWLTWQLTPGAWQIIYLLLAHPLLSTEELAVFLGLQRHSVSCSLASLHRLGCIVPTRTAVGQRWYLDALGLSLVAAANHVHLRTFALGRDESMTKDDPGSLTISSEESPGSCGISSIRLASIPSLRTSLRPPIRTRITSCVGGRREPYVNDITG